MIKKGQLGEDAVMPSRKQLDHRGPLAIDISSAWYFITICASERVQYGRVAVPPATADIPDGGGTPSLPGAGYGRAAVPSATACVSDGGGTPSLPGVLMPIANEILECARQYHVRGKWKLSLFLVMPDHLHFIVYIPAGADGGGTPSLPHVIQHWKHYVSEHCGVHFQKDFWDTRLRDDAHYAEKFRYICNNQVRKGLCATARDWRHVIAFNRETGDELAHK